MDFALDENQLQVRDGARRLARSAFKDRAARWDQNSEVPWDNIKLLADQCYLGLLVPELFGGAGGAAGATATGAAGSQPGGGGGGATGTSGAGGNGRVIITVFE